MKSIAVKTLLPALLAMWAGNTAMAGDAVKIRFADELDSCVAALSQQIDLDGVYRVRHIVTEYDSRRSGYALSITTQTFAAGADRTYASYCVAHGNSRPQQLDIREVSS